MADELRQKKGSDLPIADTLGDNDSLFGIQGGVTKRFPGSLLGLAKAMFTQGLAYASGTVAAKLSKTVLVTDAPYNAVGDGVADDTAAIQAALDSGAKLIRLPARSNAAGLYKVTTTLRYKFAGQCIVGDGKAATTLIAATGTLDGIVCQGLSSCGLHNMKLAGSGNTAGALLNVYDSTGFLSADVRFDSGFNGVRFHRINNCKMERFEVVDLKGTYGILFSGDSGFKSDVLNLINGTMSHFNNPTINCIHWQSYAHSMTLDDVRVIRGGRGLFVENSSGVETGNSYPSFLQIIICEFDFSQLECMRLDCIQDAWIGNLYAHGSATESNIFVSDKCKGVRFTIPRSASAFKHGLFSAGRAVEVIGGEFWSNSQGSVGMYDGVHLGAASRGVKLVGVISGDLDNGSSARQGYGLNIQAGASRVQYLGNGFEGNVTGTVNSQNDLSYEVGGSYRHSFRNTNGVHFEMGGASPGTVNQFRAAGSAAGGAAQLVAQGIDTNINARLVPKGSGTFELPISNVPNFADDTAAAAGGVVVGGQYRTGSALKIRVS